MKKYKLFQDLTDSERSILLSYLGTKSKEFTLSTINECMFNIKRNKKIGIIPIPYYMKV